MQIVIELHEDITYQEAQNLALDIRCDYGDKLRPESMFRLAPVRVVR